jgi:hypothetical protein
MNPVDDTADVNLEFIKEYEWRRLPLELRVLIFLDAFKRISLYDRQRVIRHILKDVCSLKEDVTPVLETILSFPIMAIVPVYIQITSMPRHQSWLENNSRFIKSMVRKNLNPKEIVLWLNIEFTLYKNEKEQERLWKELSSYTKLRTLEFYIFGKVSMPPNEEGIESLANLKNLSLYCYEVSDEFLDTIQKLPNLKSFNLHSNLPTIRPSDDEEFVPFDNDFMFMYKSLSFSRLKRLSLKKIKFIEPGGLPLFELPELTWLILDHITFLPKMIKNLTRLEKLKLRENYYPQAAELEINTYTFLSTFVNLKELIIDYIQINQTELEAVCTLTNLQSLEIMTEQNITTLEPITNLINLTLLNLYELNITVPTFNFLRNLKHLRFLSLAFLRSGHARVLLDGPSLIELPKLEYLYLNEIELFIPNDEFFEEFDKLSEWKFGDETTYRYPEEEGGGEGEGFIFDDEGNLIELAEVPPLANEEDIEEDIDGN